MVILEAVLSTVIVSATIYLVNKVKNRVSKYGKFLIYFTKQDQAIPWVAKEYNTEDEFIFDEKNIASIAMNPDKNKIFSMIGMDGIGAYNINEKRDEYWYCFINK